MNMKKHILLIAFPPLGRPPLCLEVDGRLCSGATIRGCLLMLLFVNEGTDSSKGTRATARCAFFSLREVSIFTMNCLISNGSGGLTEQLSSEGSLCLSTSGGGGCFLGGDVDLTDLCCGLATSSSRREGMVVAGCSCCLAERIQSTCDI